jgi:hypothetical protein
MTTDRQTESNRINAQKSCGPVSPEGKEKASRNSLRHGMLAECIVLDGESRDGFADLIQALHERFRPTDVHETALIETMAVAHWRKMRLWVLESASVNHEIRRQTDDPDASPGQKLDSPTRAALAVKSLCDNSSILRLLNRYDTSYGRQYSKAHTMLLECREKAAKSQKESVLAAEDYL